MYGHKIKIFNFENEDIIFAKNLKLPISWDLVHASVAVRTNCDVICTWNVKDFDLIADKIDILKPDQL